MHVRAHDSNDGAEARVTLLYVAHCLFQGSGLLLRFQRLAADEIIPTYVVSIRRRYTALAPPPTARAMAALPV